MMPACGPPSSLSPENVTMSQARTESAIVGSSAIASMAPLPRSSTSRILCAPAMPASSRSEADSVKPLTR